MRRSRRADAPRRPLLARTQQPARVAPEDLERFRATALESPDAAPGWGLPRDFLDHDEVYDGFGGPRRLLTSAAVMDIAHAIDAIDRLLTDLPAARQDAAAACGFDGGFNGDVRPHLVAHFVVRVD
jgi:hypothetical protein